jgi:transposase
MTKKKTSALTPLAAQAGEGPLERTVYSTEFKLEAVQRMREGPLSATALALELGIRRNQLYK